MCNFTGVHKESNFKHCLNNQPEVTIESKALRTWTWTPSSVCGPEKQLATVAVKWSSKSGGKSCLVDGSDSNEIFIILTDNLSFIFV